MLASFSSISKDVCGRLDRQCELFIVLTPCLLGSRVIGANMGCKLFIALQLEVAHHFIERCAGGRTRRFEPPATLGATKTPKTLFLNPYQLTSHGRLCRCTPTSTCLFSRDEAFWFAINGSPSQLHTAQIAAETIPGLGVAKDAQKRRFYIRKFGWSVGHPTYTEDFVRARESLAPV
jgi:hypothetical protein